MLHKPILAALFSFILFWSLWQISRIEHFQIFGTLISEIATEKPLIALTFDDGPTRKFTPDILATLDTLDIPATFFVNGLPLAKNPDIGEQILAQGHELANHGYTHKNMAFMPPWRVKREIEDTDAIIRDLGYEGEIHFRPPYGKKLFFLPLYLSRHNRPTIMWSMAPEENVSSDQDADALTAYVIEHAKPGQIILFHPMFSSGERTRSALPAIIQGLRNAGYELVTLSKLLEAQ